MVRGFGATPFCLFREIQHHSGDEDDNNPRQDLVTRPPGRIGSGAVTSLGIHLGIANEASDVPSGQEIVGGRIAPASHPFDRPGSDYDYGCEIPANDQPSECCNGPGGLARFRLEKTILIAFLKRFSRPKITGVAEICLSFACLESP